MLGWPYHSVGQHWRTKYFRNKQSLLFILTKTRSSGSIACSLALHANCRAQSSDRPSGGAIHTLSSQPLSPPSFTTSEELKVEWQGAFLLWACSYLTSTTVGIRSFSNVIPFPLPLGCPYLFILLGWFLLAFEFETPDADVSTITGRNFFFLAIYWRSYHFLLLFSLFHPRRKDRCWYILYILQSPN